MKQRSTTLCHKILFLLWEKGPLPEVVIEQQTSLGGKLLWPLLKELRIEREIERLPNTRIWRLTQKQR